MRVRFLQRYGAYFPGADPILNDPAEAKRLIALGICEPFDKPVAPVVEQEPPKPADDVKTEASEEVPAPHPLRRRGGK